MSKLKFIISGYLLTVIGLFLYSYTQVDLNLTLSQWSIWKTIQTSFQYIGWFNRPLSTLIYLIILLLLTVCYLLFLWNIKRKQLLARHFWWLIGGMSLILLFSYNAFSYDLFNYMFDARIFTLHQQNPYLYKALDFPNDPWINFMRWTHRTYPYGPVWLGLTIPLSYLGFQIFLPTLFLFKALMVGSFIGTIYFIGKIFQKIKPADGLFGMAFFALNPLVIIESLVSAHHDIVMVFLVTMAIYHLLNKNYIRAFLLLFLSIGIKFATILLIPIFIIVLLWQIKRRLIENETLFSYSLAAMVMAIIFASQRTELQPWYLLWLFPFVSLLTRRLLIIVSFLLLSVGLLLHYAPFLYSGNWNPPIPTIKLWITASFLISSFILWKIFKKAKGIML